MNDSLPVLRPLDRPHYTETDNVAWFLREHQERNAERSFCGALLRRPHAFGDNELTPVESPDSSCPGSPTS